MANTHILMIRTAEGIALYVQDPGFDFQQYKKTNY